MGKGKVTERWVSDPRARPSQPSRSGRPAALSVGREEPPSRDDAVGSPWCADV